MTEDTQRHLFPIIVAKGYSEDDSLTDILSYIFFSNAHAPCHNVSDFNHIHIKLCIILKGQIKDSF